MLTTDITAEKIVEKTKRMLGKNYKGDKETVPVYSTFSPIIGHTDSFLTITNNGFSEEEIKLIQEKIKNYAWWIVNKGYLVDSTKKEIPALFIFGSEAGSIPPDVLNFNGVTINNFYAPINRTNLTGDVTNSSNHVYVEFIKDEELIKYETELNGNNSGFIEIDEINYEFYSGRLYPEDRVIIDNNIVYPIQLVSNLDYYSISLDGEAESLEGAHDFDFAERNNLEILEDVCDLVIHEAAQWTNRQINTLFLNDCWPIIVKCACMAYLNRGAEGLASQSELGQQSVFNDWVTVMHQQLTNRRYIL